MEPIPSPVAGTGSSVVVVAKKRLLVCVAVVLLLIAVLASCIIVGFHSGFFSGLSDVANCPITQLMAFSAQQKDIAQRDVFLTCLNGEDNIFTVTRGEGDSLNPSLSPDGQYVIYQNNRDGSWEIFLFDRATREERQLTEGAGDSTFPSFSPDGSLIAFSSNRTGTNGIYTMTSEGEYETKLIERGDAYPHFSPDGTKIVFSSTGGTVGGSEQIYLMEKTGKNLRRITTSPGTASAPVFSPDGTIIAYEFMADGTEDYEVFLFDLVTREPRQLTYAFTSHDGLPAYTAHGSLVYTSFRGDGSVLVSVSLDGLTQTGRGEQLFEDLGLTNYWSAAFPATH
jgi:Tol biopolymer transport system component